MIDAPFMRKPWVRFRNDNSGTIPPFGVMRITGTTTINNEIVYTVDQPNTTFYRIYLVNGPKAVHTGKAGMATFLWNGGYVLVEATAALGESWGPATGQWTLKKWRYGFTPMGASKALGSYTVVAAVQSPVNHVWGQTDGAVNKGSSGTVEVYDGNDAQITSTNLSSVKNKYGNVADNKKVSVEWLGGSWYMKAAEC